MSTKKKGFLILDVERRQHLRSHRGVPTGNFWHRHRMATHRELRTQVKEIEDEREIKE